jgi:FMN phosphatase YigB (HAD superfamily)
MQLPYQQFLFFDDIPANIDAARRLGVGAKLVDPRDGLSWKALEEGLAMFWARQQERQSMRKWLLQSREVGAEACDENEEVEITRKRRKT